MGERVPTVVEIADLPVEALPPLVHVPPITRPFDVTIRPPGSKSLTNRALLLTALARGTSTLRHALVEADDARVMLRAIEQLGARVEQVDAETLRIMGVGGRWKIGAGETVTLNLNNAGTATRFLAAAAVLAPPESGGVIIDGNARMRERPIGELVAAMNALTDPYPCASYLGQEGHPPVHVRSDRVAWVSGMVQAFGRTQSSQFVSAVLLIAPFLPYGLEVVFTTRDVTSRSYIEMTLGLLRNVGAAVARGADGAIRIGAASPGGGPRALEGFELDIEPDATAASSLFAAAAIVDGGRLAIEGMVTQARGGLQRDVDFVMLCAAAGARTFEGGGEEALAVTGSRQLRAVEWRLEDMPDTAMAAAVLAGFADGISVLRGLRTLRVKETDRIAALVAELGKIGVWVEPFADGDDEAVRITPPVRGVDCSPSVPGVEFDTYDDHRMAMSLALVGLRRPNVYVRDPACVRKTYPTFWRDLAKLYTSPAARA